MRLVVGDLPAKAELKKWVALLPESVRLAESLSGTESRDESCYMKTGNQPSLLTLHQPMVQAKVLFPSSESTGQSLAVQQRFADRDGLVSSKVSHLGCFLPYQQAGILPVTL